MKIDRSVSVEQHASWIATNPVVGCPNDCGYCFIKPDGLTSMKPQELWSPDEALDDLMKSKYFQDGIPVAIGTRTDMFSTPANRAFLHEFVTKWNERGIKNPLIMITKCYIPDESISLFQRLQAEGSQFIFFFSYSGLDQQIERGINHKKLRQNFTRIHEACLPIVHYWRPFMPQNSSMDKMLPVIELASENANATIVDGLRMTAAMIEQFGFWPDLQRMGIDFERVESVYTEESNENIQQFMQEIPEYPIVFGTSCAIANTLHIAEYNGVYSTAVCEKSSCPDEQRDICRSFHTRRNISDQQIHSVFERLYLSDISYSLTRDENGVPILVIEGELPHDLLVNLAQSLRVQVKVDKVQEAGYGWGSHHYKQPLIIPKTQQSNNE